MCLSFYNTMMYYSQKVVWNCIDKTIGHFQIFRRKKTFARWEKSDLRPLFRSLHCYHLSRHIAGASFNITTILCSLAFADMTIILISAPRRFTSNFRKLPYFSLLRTMFFKISFKWLRPRNWKFRSFIETTIFGVTNLILKITQYPNAQLWGIKNRICIL